MNHIYAFAAAIASILLLSSTRAFAQQIVPDRTLPNSSIVTQSGNTFTIEGGTTAGNNLFHSFQEFSIPTGREAFFNNEAQISHILTRITGNNLSHIDGLIRANGTANLFLLNPNGIVFGSNARLDIGGSFLGTTAQSIVFDNGVEFSATQPDRGVLLTVKVPIGLQLGMNPGQIEVLGNTHGFTINAESNVSPITLPLDRSGANSGLVVAESKTLALVGGDIVLKGGNLIAPSGRVELAATVGSSASIEQDSQGWIFNYSQVQGFRDVRFLEVSGVDVSDVSGIGGGNITVTGGQIQITDGSVLLVQNASPRASGQIRVNSAQSITIEGANPESTVFSGIYNDTFGEGGSQGIVLLSDRLEIFEGGQVNARTFGNAVASNIEVDAANSIAVNGFAPANPLVFSFISSTTFGTGDAGNITIVTDRLALHDGGDIATPSFGSGRGGLVSIEAGNVVELAGFVPATSQPTAIGSAAVASGSGGEVMVNAPRVILRDGALITTSTLAAGDAGNVVVNASEFIEISGVGPDVPSAIESAALNAGLGQQVLGAPSIVSGNSGIVTVNAPQITISNGGRIGAINEGVGTAGNLIVNAERIILLNSEGGITASTDSGEGGNITLTADRLLLRNQSQITTEAGGTGNGGNITLNVETLSALENSRINANAFQGSGGNIAIATEGIFLSPDSTITASSQLGIDGIVQITNPDIDTQAGLVELASTPLQPRDRIVTGCATAWQNSLTVTGDGGLPPNPEQLVEGDRPWADLRDLSQLHEESHNSLLQKTPPTRLVEANGWIVHPDGTIELVALTRRRRVSLSVCQGGRNRRPPSWA